MAKVDRRSKRVSAVAINIILDSIAEEIADSINRDLASLLRNWSMASNRNIEQREGLKAIHAILAEETRFATYQAYINSGLGKGPSYRYSDRNQFKRYSNGKMEQAILDNETISFDQNAIYLFDKSNMDKFAPQWYRLNFGTTTGRNENIAPMQVFDVPLKRSPTLARFPTSSPFTMPEGIWSSTFKASTLGGESFEAPVAGAKNAFYAIGARKRRPKTGNGKVVRGRGPGKVNQIVGRSFLDKGVEAMNKRYPELLEPLLVSWISEIKRK